MFSVIIDGEVKDLKFKKIHNWHYFGHIGDIPIGQYFKLRTGWSAVGDPQKMNNNMNNVKGFKTRLDAVEYILRCYRIGNYK